jgi:hypothetical protein
MSALTFWGAGEGFGLIWKRKMEIKPKGFEKIIAMGISRLMYWVLV